MVFQRLEVVAELQQSADLLEQQRPHLRRGDEKNSRRSLTKFTRRSANALWSSFSNEMASSEKNNAWVS
nr:hypothetical protein [Nocardioides psychrotolerans]